jgi:predicted hydrolase (HD superfamily)
MNRDEAWELLCEYIKSDSLRKHRLASKRRYAICTAARPREETGAAFGLTDRPFG